MCDRCRNFTELRICEVCGDPKRDESLLCVVEAPADVLAIEQTASYRGLYYVLMGHLSPLDGVGPEQLGLDRLSQLLSDESIEEVILATNPTMEGEATGHYIAQLARQETLKYRALRMVSLWAGSSNTSIHRRWRTLWAVGAH